MSIILPGNWVTRANVYPRRKQVGPEEYTIERHGVECIPGYAFYKLVGYYAVDEDRLVAGDYDLVIGSPDLRQDDKPRLDAPFIVPAGAAPYRSAVSVINGDATSNGDVVTIDTAPSLSGTITPGADALGGKVEFTTGELVSSSPVLTLPTTYQTADLFIKAKVVHDIARLDSRDRIVVLVEVDYIADAGAPVLDDVSLPYLTEAGSDKAYAP
jgi:hypothetical protein